VLQTGIHVRIHPRSLDFCPSFLPQSEWNRPRDPRLAAADRRAQEETAASTLESVRPTILDYPALRLVPVGRSLSSGQTRDSRRLASGWLSALLEVAIASTCWPTENYCRNSGTHPPPSRRECNRGSTQDPWRTPETRLRDLRVNRRSVSATCLSPR